MRAPKVEDDLCDTAESEVNKLLAKSCSVVRSIQWVARNLENPKVQMIDAPSAEAWGMLTSYRINPLRKAEFWDSVFVKLIPSRAQLDERPDDHVDGEGIIKTCERLIRLRDGAIMAARQTHSLEVAGSSPAPATNQPEEEAPESALNPRQEDYPS